MEFSMLVGVVVTLILVVPLVLGLRGKRRSLRELPQVAERLGLEHEGIARAGGLGRYKGRFRDHRVVVRPDAFGLIRVAFRERVAVSLSTDKAAPVTVEGVRPFDSGDRRFDRLFRHRYASPEVAERLRVDVRLREHLLTFHDTHRRALRSFAVDDQYVSVTLRQYAFFNYIPADQLEPLLHGLAGLADAIEPELR